MQRRTIAAAAFLVVPFACDLTVKKLAQDALTNVAPVTIFPAFNLTLVQNPGVSFGLFPAGTGTGLILMLIAQTIMCLGIGIYAWTKRHRLVLWPILLLLSGALANLANRYFNGAVTDYLDFYIGTFHWPAFNLADVWIALGVAGLFVTKLMSKIEMDR